MIELSLDFPRKILSSHTILTESELKQSLHIATLCQNSGQFSQKKSNAQIDVRMRNFLQFDI